MHQPLCLSLPVVVQAAAALPFQAEDQGSDTVGTQGGPRPEQTGRWHSKTWCRVQPQCTDPSGPQLQSQGGVSTPNLNLFLNVLNRHCESNTHPCEWRGAPCWWHGLVWRSLAGRGRWCTLKHKALRSHCSRSQCQSRMAVGSYGMEERTDHCEADPWSLPPQVIHDPGPQVWVHPHISCVSLGDARRT